jgi:hypothetical protein
MPACRLIRWYLGGSQQGRVADASLVEMARWKDRGHAWDARMILGRIAGIEETDLGKLATNNVEEIIRAVMKR